MERRRGRKRLNERLGFQRGRERVAEIASKYPVLYKWAARPNQLQQRELELSMTIVLQRIRTSRSGHTEPPLLPQFKSGDKMLQ